MIVTNFLLNTIKISGADWLSPPYLHVHNPNQNKNSVAIYSLNLSGNVASAEPGCQHVPGPHLHGRRVPPLSHSQVLGDYTISILIISIAQQSESIMGNGERMKMKMCVIVTFHNIYPSHVFDRVIADKKFKEIV